MPSGRLWSVSSPGLTFDQTKFCASCKRCSCVFTVPFKYVESGGHRPHCYHCRIFHRKNRTWQNGLTVTQKGALEKTLGTIVLGIVAHSVFTDPKLMRIIGSFNREEIDHPLPIFMNMEDNFPRLSPTKIKGHTNTSENLSWADECEDCPGWSEPFSAIVSCC